MIRILLLIFSFAMLFGGELKIANFNVENLFDGQNNGSEYPDFIIGKSNWNNEKYIKKLEKISFIIRDINADIVALEEVENKNVLENLAKKSGYEFYEFSKNKNSPFGVGIISKIKIQKSSFLRLKQIKSRDILKADFEFEGEKFSIFVNHFPAAKNPLRDRKIAARALETELKGVKNAIAIGDFNTDYGSKSLLNDIIRKQNFVDLWKFMPTNKRISHISGRAIDHVLLSSDFFDKKELEYKNSSFGVYKPGITSTVFGNKNRYSDHYPIFFTITNDIKDFTGLNLKTVSLNELYEQGNIKKPVRLEKVAVIYKDKFGFVVAQDKQGIYVFEKNNDDIVVGSLIDLEVSGMEKYRNNLEINSYEIKKTYDKTVNIKDFMLLAKDLHKARSGDVIDKISGDVYNGYLKNKYQNIRIYSHNKKIPNGKNQTFENALFKIYKGEREIIVK